MQKAKGFQGGIHQIFKSSSFTTWNLVFRPWWPPGSSNFDPWFNLLADATWLVEMSFEVSFMVGSVYYESGSCPGWFTIDLWWFQRGERGCEHLHGNSLCKGPPFPALSDVETLNSNLEASVSQSVNQPASSQCLNDNKICTTWSCFEAEAMAGTVSPPKWRWMPFVSNLYWWPSNQGLVVVDYDLLKHCRHDVISKCQTFEACLDVHVLTYKTTCQEQWIKDVVNENSTMLDRFAIQFSALARATARFELETSPQIDLKVIDLLQVISHHLPTLPASLVYIGCCRSLRLRLSPFFFSLAICQPFERRLAPPTHWHIQIIAQLSLASKVMSFFGFDSNLPGDKRNTAQKGIFEHTDAFGGLQQTRKLAAFQNNEDEMYGQKILFQRVLTRPDSTLKTHTMD